LFHFALEDVTDETDAALRSAQPFWDEWGTLGLWRMMVLE
jgi:hypothetical protein